MSIKATISRGVTAEFQTHHRGCAPDYRGLTAPFSESFPVPAGNCGITAVAVTMSFSTCYTHFVAWRVIILF